MPNVPLKFMTRGQKAHMGGGGRRSYGRRSYGRRSYGRSRSYGRRRY